MEVTFKFTNGETGAEIVQAIGNLFNATSVAPGGAVVAHAPTPAATIATADNPETGETVNANAPAADSTGLPWDARIHSASKAITEKGTWRKRKGVDDITFASVTRQLQEAAGQAAPVVSVPAGAGAVATVITPPVAAAPVAPSLPAAPAALTPPPALAPAKPVETPFTQLVSFLVGHTNSPSNPTGRLTEQYISDSLTHWGYTGGLPALVAQTPEVITQIRAAFAQALGLPAGS